MAGCRNVKQFLEGLVFKAQRLVYHSTLGWIVTEKKKRSEVQPFPPPRVRHAPA